MPHINRICLTDGNPEWLTDTYISDGRANPPSSPSSTKGRLPPPALRRVRWSDGAWGRPDVSGGAVFFDLDRTLLKRSSGLLLNEALVDAGLIPDRPVPGMGLLYRFNDIVGESLPA